MLEIKTKSGKNVVVGKFYELKYKWGDSYEYGYGWVNPNKYKDYIDIICHNGGVTYQNYKDVIFFRQIKQ